MSLVMALQDVKPEFVNKPGKVKPGGPSSLGTTFFRPTIDQPYGPHASLVRYPSGQLRTSSAHFHEVDQFQVIMEGTGTFGRHHVSPYSIHFSRAYTRYGPLKSDGWTFMVMRSRYDPGSQRDVEKLKQIPNRQPWQITSHVTFPAPSAGANTQEVPEIKDDQGLFASTLTMAPHATTSAPDPSSGDGQHVLVVKGSILHENREKQAPVVVFTRPDEPAFEIHAGAHGLQAIIMNLPKVASHAASFKAPSSASGLKKWQCVLCAFAYDEALGMPEEGIAPGTRWAEVPDTWSCPDCGAGKSDFEMVEV